MYHAFEIHENARAVPLPDWIPCQACGLGLRTHVDGKCLFSETRFTPDDAKLLWTALYQLRRDIQNKNNQGRLKMNMDDVERDPELRVRWFNDALQRVRQQKGEVW